MERAKIILRKIIEDRLNIKYIAHSRSTTLDQELTNLLKESGCVELRAGGESGSPRILEQITAPRKQSVEKLYEIADMCKKANLSLHISFIISHPRETLDDVEKTMDVIRRLKKLNVDTNLNVMHIYPGSEVEEYAREHNILPKDFSWSKKYAKEELEIISPFSSEIPAFIENISLYTIYKYLARWSYINRRSVLTIIPQIISNIRSLSDIKRILIMTKAYLLRWK